MYRGGLIFSLILYLITIVFLALGLTLWSDTYQAVQSGGDTLVVNGETLDTGVVSHVGSVVDIMIYIMLMFNILGSVFSIWGLSNFYQAKRGMTKFKKGVAITAGIFGIFSNLIGGILILVGMSNVEEYLVEFQNPHTFKREQGYQR